jgi:hypothetical protein
MAVLLQGIGRRTLTEWHCSERYPTNPLGEKAALIESFRLLFVASYCWWAQSSRGLTAIFSLATPRSSRSSIVTSRHLSSCASAT